MNEREFAAVSRVTGEVLMTHEGTYSEALDAFDRLYGTEVDYVVEQLPCRSDSPHPAYQDSRF